MKNPEKHKIDDGRLDAWLTSAPMLPPSRIFVDDVMQAVRARKRGWYQRLLAFCFAPHVVRFNFAGAAAMALLLAVGSAWMLSERQLPSPSSAQLAARSDGTIKVRFSLDAHGAHQVAVVGDFTRWQSQVPLRRAADGTWIAEISLRPGDYEYMFVVDQARWVSDPRAPRYRADGFGNRNAIVTVPSV